MQFILSSVFNDGDGDDDVVEVEDNIPELVGSSQVLVVVGNSQELVVVDNSQELVVVDNSQELMVVDSSQVVENEDDDGDDDEDDHEDNANLLDPCLCL